MIEARFRQPFLSFLLSVVLAFFSAYGHAEDFDDLVKRCGICHGEDGNSKLPMFPSIAGFSYQGFLSTMKVYRENRRIAVEFQQPGELETIMNTYAQQLSDAQIEALAKYYSEQPYVPVRQEFDPGLASRGEVLHQRHCEQCHLENGTDPTDDLPVLAGQWTPYLRLQFKNIISGKRLMPQRMLIRFKKLNQDDIEALLNFYNSVN